MVQLQSRALCQQVNVITIDQLHNRINEQNDTTYIINFWATWCAPCIKELPYFETLSDQFKTKKLKVLLVSVDFKSELNSSLKPFVKRRKLMNELFVLNEKNQQELIDKIDTSWSGAIPATLFIKNNIRKFVEKEFTYSELVKEYKSFLSL